MSAKSPCRPLPRREAACAGLGLAARNRRKPEAKLVQRSLLPAEPPLLDRGEPIAAQRRLRQAAQIVGEAARFGERRAGCDDAVGEPDPSGLFAGDAASGENHVHRAAVPDQPRQADGAEIHQRYAEAPAINAEGGVTRDDPKIAPDRKLEAARHGGALDGGDHRLRQLHPRRAHRAVAVLDAVAAMAGRGALEVEAGAERAARAGQDRDRQRRIAIEGAERLRQPLRGLRIDRIARLVIAIDGHDRDGLLGSVFDGRVVQHARSSAVRSDQRAPVRLSMIAARFW
ncbi:hypothetical protein ABIF16_002664 [Bradyrhizobium elkanii]